MIGRPGLASDARGKSWCWRTYDMLCSNCDSEALYEAGLHLTRLRFARLVSSAVLVLVRTFRCVSLACYVLQSRASTA